MTHDEAHSLIDPYVDHELDVANAREVESHLRTCAECRAAEQRLRALGNIFTRTDPGYRAPYALKRNIRAALRRETRSTGVNLWWAAGAAFACALLLAGFLLPSRLSKNSIADEVIANHVRSLLGTHLLDVPSSDHHTVKPWFDGKIDFAPEVPDLASSGFPLVGGRLDYLNGRTVAALVYQRNKHPINVFVSPSGDGRSSDTHLITRRGYNVIQWSRGGLAYWAVSDLNAPELQEFVNHFRG